MEKNTIVAIVLSIVFLVTWYYLSPPKQTVQPAAQPTAQQIDHTQPSSTPAVLEKQIIHENNTSSFRETSSKEKNFLIETPRSRIRFTTRGAAITSWQIPDINGWLDLVYQLDANNLPTGTWNDSIFTTANDSEVIDADAKYHDIIFTHTTPEGLAIRKTYRLYSNQYISEIFLTCINTSKKNTIAQDWSIGWGPGINTIERELPENLKLSRAIGLGEKKLERFGNQRYEARYEWVAVDNRYFLAALIPQTQEGFTYIDATRYASIKPNNKKEMLVRFLWHAGLELKPGEEKTFSFKVYIGPKGYDHLKKLGYRLEESIDFGTFGFLGKLALATLKFFKKVTGNYGWAIVLLTIFLQGFFIPLTLKSFKANLAMKKLQPQIKLLQTKYKEDPKRLNVEIMNLYKTSGTNPFGGCVPMLLQIPVFWALFVTLRNAFELRGAPFILWIKDLSVYDPLYVLPILMGIGMFVQQKTMSVQTDPQQAKMMMFMPIIFTFLFFKFPAGLVLYWFVNSLLSMAVQYGYQKAKQSQQ